MAFDNSKYKSTVTWRTYFINTTLNTNATDDTPALWDTNVCPIDVNENGADPMLLEVGFWCISNAGYLYLIKETNVDSDQYRITVEDTFFSGYAPTGGLRGIVYKSAYKGYAFAIAPVWLSYLDNIARDYVNSLEKSIFWQNDPNSRRITFTNVEQVSISNYRADVSDSDGNIFNPMEDYGQNPTLKIFVLNEDGTYSRVFLGENITNSLVDGLIDSIVWSSSGDTMTGYIAISK